MLKREEKESMKVKRTICLLLTFMMVLSSFSTAFAANGIMSNGQQQEPSEAIRNYANKAVKLYRYMTQDERAVIKTTKTKLENLNTDDSLWASVLNGLLTEEVTERFGNEGQARSALKELVSDVLMIQFLPSTQDVDDLVQEIENIKNENKDNIERLLNPDSDIQITVDAFVDYLCETAETYTSPEYIKNSGYAHILSEGTNQQVVTTLHTMIKNIIKDEINQNSEIANQIRALGWDADRLHSSFKLLKDNIKDEGNNNLAEKSELILFKAAIRTQADLYKMTVMDDEVIGETAVDLTYAEGSDRIHGITYYDLRVLEKSYNGSIGVEADSDVVTVEYEIIGAQREFVKITPKSGISDGRCTLIFYRDPLSQGIPEDDWIVKLNVTIDTVNVPNYNVSVNKKEVQRGENIIITGTGPIGKSVIVWVRDKNGATKYTGTEVIDPDGKFSLTLKIGDSWEEGEYTVYVGEGTNTAQTTFHVREKEIVSYTVQVNKAKVQPGESITITGTGPVGKSIIIWVRDKNGATQYTGTEVIDPDGKFSLTLTIGDSWEEGEYTVYVGEGTNTAQTTFRVRIKEVVSYTVQVNKTEVQRGENIIITGTGPVGKSVIVLVRDKNGATKYNSAEVIDSDGKFSLTLKIGDSWEEGEYTVYVGEGTNTAQATFHVKTTTGIVPVEKVFLNKSELTLAVGQTEQLIATIEPENATNKNVSWSSSNEEVATVDEDGTVRAVGAGTATITVTTEDGGYTATCTVTVNAATVSVTGVSLDKNELTLTVGDTEKLTATVEPPNASNKNVSWSSSDEAVATVSADGTVTAVGAGTATITVTTEDGNKTATCKVTVIVPVERVSLNKSELTLVVGQTEQLIATIEPWNATNKNVSWSSSNEEVATVDEDGTVTAVGAGTATITVTTEDGNKTATCTVTVTLPSEKKIISFTIPGQIGETIIDHDKHTIKVFVPRGTDKTKLVPTISVSEGATVSPASGVEVDFTSQVTYTVTAADGSTQPYTVIVTEPILITNQETTVDNENPVVEIPSTDIGEENIVIRIPEDVKNPVIVIDIPEDSSSEIQNVTIDAAAGTTPVIYVVKRPLSGTNENEVEVELPLAINVVMHGFSEELDSVEITIPQGTVITANKEWDGNISLPQLVGSAERKQTVQQKIEQAPENTNKAKVKELDVIQIGSSALEIKFDQPIRLLFKDKAKNNKKIKLGYIDENDNFIPITFILSSDETEKVAEELEENQKREGWLIVRNDVVVWTTHFTEYVVYVENEAPVAQGVNISGSLRVGQTLTGSYRYADLENDAEGDTELRWYRASSQTGKDKQLISTGTNKYKLTSSDKGMYIFFEVIPKAKTGTEIGEPNIAIRGPILAQSGGSGSSGTGSSKTIVMTPVEVSLPQDVIGHWAQDYIRELMERQAVSGYPDGTFRPNANITRAEFATILVKALNLQPRAGKVFNDTVNHWAKDVISTAHAHGIINGYDDNTFGPDDYITREQMAVMIARAAGLYNAAAGTQFADSNTFSEWAVNAIAAISEKGIITGYPDGTFKPKNYATRAEAATVITKILKYLNK